MESISNYLPILIQIILAVGIGLGILFVSHLFGQRSRGNRFKDAPYECGLNPAGKTQSRFAVKFYVTAMLFILFDIEVVFLYPWAVAFTDLGLGGFLAMAVFILILAESLIYLWLKGVLSWK